MDSIDDIFYYGKESTTVDKVREEIASGKYCALQTLTDQLKRSMVKAESKHQEYDNSCQNVRQTCILAAEESKEMRIEAQSKKKATQGVGGALAATTMAAGVGTGVALSVVAGVFTFGIGTVVGLGITAGATAIGGVAVGTGTAIATHVIAMDFEKTEKALRSLSFTLDSMERLSSDLLNSFKSKTSLQSRR